MIHNRVKELCCMFKKMKKNVRCCCNACLPYVYGNLAESCGMSEV